MLRDQSMADNKVQLHNDRSTCCSGTLYLSLATSFRSCQAGQNRETLQMSVCRMGRAVTLGLH
jgi:hypothetical protein